MALEAIRDQPRAVELLRRALAGGRVAHAYAFVGPSGSGRMTTALAFAEALLCETGQACGRCRACQLVARGQHPDLHVIMPTPPESNPKGARTIRIGAVRELERQASLRPVLGGRRVLVLDEADRMTDDAPQAFLKFLEEPPPETVVILVLSRRARPAGHGHLALSDRSLSAPGMQTRRAPRWARRWPSSRPRGPRACRRSSGGPIAWIATGPRCSSTAAGCSAAICCWFAPGRPRPC